MSKRFAGTALLVSMLAANAYAEMPTDTLYADARVVQLGESSWELFRPECRTQTLFDLTYLTSDLWSERAGLGLRFRSSAQLSFDVRVDPFTQPRDVIGPVDDFNLGATIFALRIRF